MDASKAEKMAQACEAIIDNDLIGYGQEYRNSLLEECKKNGFDIKRIKVPCGTDCSALMAICAQTAHIEVPYSYGNAPTTRTMEKAFLSTGIFDILRDPIYTRQDLFLRRGDILVKAGSHTVMALENGKGKPYPTLKLGSKNEFVGIAQARLNFYGFKLKIDNDYGPATKQAVISFQGLNNLIKDGVIGEMTWAKLK